LTYRKSHPEKIAGTVGKKQTIHSRKKKKSRRGPAKFSWQQPTIKPNPEKKRVPLCKQKEGKNNANEQPGSFGQVQIRNGNKCLTVEKN